MVWDRIQKQPADRMGKYAFNPYLIRHQNMRQTDHLHISHMLSSFRNPQDHRQIQVCQRLLNEAIKKKQRIITQYFLCEQWWLIILYKMFLG